MTDLDLKELDRLEAATQGRQYYAHPKRHNPPYFLMRSREEASTWGSAANYGAEWHEIELSAGIRNQLRPLLDLVERMGVALEGVGDMQCLQAFRGDGTCCCPACSQAEALEAYRRAKGE